MSLPGHHRSGNDPELRAEYEKIAEQVRQTKESTLQVVKPHFTAPVDTIEGTVEHASARGISLKEYPGRTSSSSAPWEAPWQTWCLPPATQ